MPPRKQLLPKLPATKTAYLLPLHRRYIHCNRKLQANRNLKSYFEEHSQLSFTYEIESCKELSFLDTIIRRNKEQLRSAVYRKPTNIGECLNYSSICPNKYKTGVINFFLHRAYNICSDYTSLTTEIARIKQLLINNNFPNYLVDQVTKEFINKKQDNKLHAQNKRHSEHRTTKQPS